MPKQPWNMTPDEIKAEVGAILIRGYLRTRFGPIPTEQTIDQKEPGTKESKT